MQTSLNLGRRRGEAGFNLVEAAIVLGIVGLIIGGIWAAAAAVYENWRAGKGNQQLLQIVQNVRSLYANQGTFGTPSVLQLNQAGVFPMEMRRSGSSVVDSLLDHPWSTGGAAGGCAGTVCVAAGASGQEFGVTFGGLPREACINMITRSSQQTGQIGLLQVGGIDLRNATTAVDVASAAAQCPNAAANNITWTFRLRG